MRSPHRPTDAAPNAERSSTISVLVLVWVPVPVLQLSTRIAARPERIREVAAYRLLLEALIAIAGLASPSLGYHDPPT